MIASEGMDDPGTGLRCPGPRAEAWFAHGVSQSNTRPGMQPGGQILPELRQFA